jgi:hypothetical protein
MHAAADSHLVIMSSQAQFLHEGCLTTSAAAAAAPVATTAAATAVVTAAAPCYCVPQLL